MNRFRIVAVLAVVLLMGCSAAPGPTPTSPAASPVPATATRAAPSPTPLGPPGKLILATTTSTADSGLLEAILPEFEKANNCKVDVIAVGTGQALALGAKGDADVVLVHARAQEDKFVADGDGIDRRDVMYNDFVLVGPPADPARVSGETVAAEAFKKIASAKASFASRGDKSGTETKEKAIWTAAGIAPQGDWYLSLGQGMGDTLLFSSEKGAYTLSDRATFLSMKDKLKLTVLVGGDSIAQNKDKDLLNPYGVIPVNPAKHPNVNSSLASKFAEWITSLATQQAIGEFGKAKFGQPLFYPDSAAWRAR